MTPVASLLVHVPAGLATLHGDLSVPAAPRAVVLFAHGSGSSRHSPRNQAVAAYLQRRGYATLLIDLLTDEEDAVDRLTSRFRFDIPRLASRLVAIADWLRRDPALTGLPVGLFGASTGGGAALVAAASRPDAIAAVVSRGGRPDLAAGALARVAAPTLLIVGALDEAVIELNRAAMTRMHGNVSLAIVPGAAHVFEEPGALEQVAELTADWFDRYLSASPPRAAAGQLA
jgi:putative phosphoribosyl transferase